MNNVFDWVVDHPGLEVKIFTEEDIDCIVVEFTERTTRRRLKHAFSPLELEALSDDPILILDYLYDEFKMLSHKQTIFMEELT